MEAAMNAAKEQAAELGIERPKLLAITALTSFDDENWSAIGGSLPISDHVVKLAKLAKEAGVDGVVASPLEAKLIREACGEDLLINGYFRNVWLVRDKKAEEYYRTMRPDKPYFPNTVSQEEFISKTYNKMHFIGKHESLLKLQKKLREELTNKNLNMVFVGEHCLEIFSNDSNKALAAEFVLKRDGIKLEEAIAFGDSVNDFEMLTEVGRGFVMGNAIYLLKEMAKDLEIIETNHNDGEAKKIVEIFNLEV